MPSSGEISRALRERMALGVTETARLAGITPQTVINLEKRPGNWTNIYLSTLSGLATAYGVPIHTMVEIARGREPTPGTLRLETGWFRVPLRKPGEQDLNHDEIPAALFAVIPHMHVSDPERIQAYRVTPETFMSDEARTDGAVRVGDAIAVDPNADVPIGGLALMYWAEQNALMIVSRIIMDEERPYAKPEGWIRKLDPSSRPVRVTTEQDVRLIGPIVWRGG